MPLMFSYSGVLPAGAALDAPVNHLDVTPTVLDLVGLPVPAHMRGRSLVPLMTGQGPLPQQPILAEMDGETAEDGGPHWIAPSTHLYAIKENGYKYIHAERLPADDQLFAMQPASVFEGQNIIAGEPETAQALWQQLQTSFTIPTEFTYLPLVNR